MVAPKVCIDRLLPADLMAHRETSGDRAIIPIGKLWMNGVTPLELADNGRFYLRDEPDSPEWVSFSDIVEGKAMLMRMSGYVLLRV